MNCLSACNTTLVFRRRCIIRPMRHFRLGMIGVFALALFTVAAAQPPAQLVIANVRVFTGERSIERASITVADGKIVRITTDAPATTGVTIDGAGKTALPGLIDSHIHVLKDGDDRGGNPRLHQGPAAGEAPELPAAWRDHGQVGWRYDRAHSESTAGSPRRNSCGASALGRGTGLHRARRSPRGHDLQRQ